MALQPFSMLELHPFNTYYSHRARPPVSSSDKGGDEETFEKFADKGGFKKTCFLTPVKSQTGKPDGFQTSNPGTTGFVQPNAPQTGPLFSVP